MVRPRISLFALVFFLAACASTQSRELAKQNREDINQALAEAAAVEIPDAEAPSYDILDELVPGSGISVPGLGEDLYQELAFDISVSKAPARLFFMSLVIVRAMPGELRDVEAYLTDAEDSLQRQVILEAKVIEVDLNDRFQSGVDWAALSSSRDLAIGNAGLVRGVGRVLADEAGAPLLNAAGDAVISSNADLGNIPYANLFAVGSSSSTFASLITLLSTQGNVHVLSSPRVSTVNNQKAVIKVGTDEFFVTEVSSDSTSTASGTTTTPELTLTPFFSGIALDVTPQISKDGEVILHIHPSISEVDDQTKVITLGGETFELPLALSTVRETDSVVKAQNGQVVVIGGLMMNITSDEVGGVPGISDVPIVGEAFKQKRKSSRRSELVILLRPVVVDKNKVWSNYIKQSSERVRQLNLDPEGG